MSFKGFRSKYWCDDPETGLCQDRSNPGTVDFMILDNSKVRLEIGAAANT
jgi:hypothetical protein